MTLQLANYFTQHALLSLGEGRSYRFKGSGDDDDHLQDCVLGLKPSLRSMCVSPRPWRKLLLSSQIQFNTLTHTFISHTHTESGGQVALYMCVNEAASLTKIGLYKCVRLHRSLKIGVYSTLECVRIHRPLMYLLNRCVWGVFFLFFFWGEGVYLFIYL